LWRIFAKSRKIVYYYRNNQTEVFGVRLMELLVAVSIMSLLATTAMWLAGDIPPAVNTDAAARQLARELQAARQMARAKGITVEMVFFRAQRCYIIRQEVVGAPPARRVDLPPGVFWISIPFENIRFHPSGRATRNGTFILGHGQWDGQTRVVVAPSTGRVRLEHPQ